MTSLSNVHIESTAQNTVIGTDDTSVSNNKSTTLYTFTLTPGLYIMEFQVSWSSNANGFRVLGVAINGDSNETMGNIYQSVIAPAEGVTTRQHLIYFTQPSRTTTYDLRVKQTSGTSLTTKIRMGKIQLLAR